MWMYNSGTLLLLDILSVLATTGNCIILVQCGTILKGYVGKDSQLVHAKNACVES